MEPIFFFYLLFFLFGLATGSFLNSIIFRLQTKESFLFTRSYCPYCKHKINWQDLVPLFSFLILKGKCRYCSQKISWQYPLVELTTGILFVLIFRRSIYNLQFTIYNLIIACFLIIIFVYDFKHYIIPDKIIYPAIVIAFLYQIFNFQLQSYGEPLVSFDSAIFNSILSALGAAAFFLLIVLLSKGKWMGFGDVKLALFMGLFLGFPDILVALFLAFFIGAIIGVGLILVGRKTLKSEVPFGPLLVTGTFITFFFGNQIVNWYLNLIQIY